MPIKDCQTEKHIVDTAMKVFFTEGRINATTQEIADAAGINRTLINYYFRSKKTLFNYVVKKAKEEFIGNSDLILSSDLPIKEKTERFIDDFMNNLEKYPYLESYMTVEIIKQRLNKNDLDVPEEKQPTPINKYLNEIEKEMSAGNIPATNPVHFILNLFSLMIYPQIMKPLQMKLLNLNENEYNKILDERKQLILTILFS
ncbi:MAG: TetR/AcrR family transcriptional regulator [Bacteroidales bacterium]|nr:TetR/AcrR family transcriptional regulator [Bacteroidales bacterium]